MATQAHAPPTNAMRRYRRVVRLPVTGANIGGYVSLVGGERDMVILGTIAAFGVNGLPTLTTNFGPLNPAAAGGFNNVAGTTTAPAAATASTAATVNGAPTGPTFHNASIAAIVNGVATGSTPATASTAPTVNGVATGSTFHGASTASTVNGVITGYITSTVPNQLTINGVNTGPTPSTTSTVSTINGNTTGYAPPFTAPTVPTANGAINTSTLTFAPMTSLPSSNHGLPYELTDLLVSFKECKGIFKCIRDVHANTFTQLAIVSLNSHMREALLIPPTITVTYPIVHMAGTLAFHPSEEALCFEISWVVDHRVGFMIKASTSQNPLW